MISREQLKSEIDRVDDHTLSILSKVVMALKSPTTQAAILIMEFEAR